MSLRAIKTIVYLAIIALAIIVDCIGGMFGWVVASVMLGGAIPALRCVTRAAERRGISDYRRLRRSTARHILSTAQEARDVREAGR